MAESGTCRSGNLGDESSVIIGEDVDQFDRTNIPLKSPIDFVGKCKNNAVMCCWPRDRQCGDNNGNCNNNGCADSDPADNTNLCFLEKEESKHKHLGSGVKAEIFLDESEGDLHCHGFAWTEDLNDISAKFAGSNLFYVSMYDHMYTRGYVGNLPGQPMCNCVEEMTPMSRSDCTQLDHSKTNKFWNNPYINKQFTLSYKNNFITLHKGDGMKGELIEFNTCKGLKRTNDLFEHMHLMTIQGKLQRYKLENVKKTLFGWRNTNVSICLRWNKEILRRV